MYRDFRVFDCDWMTDEKAAAAIGWFVGGARASGQAEIVLLREVQALSPAVQAWLSERLWPAQPGAPVPRVFASASCDLFERVRRGAFDQSLFYRLNTIAITPDIAGCLTL